MKAAVYHQYGGPEVVHIEEVPKPIPKDNEILIKTHASTVSSGDWRARSLEMPPGFGLIGRLVFGLTKPKQTVLGTELSGVVEAVGPDVTRFKVGDAVFAFSGVHMGCHAEYKVVAQDSPVALKPDTLSFAEAAALSFGGTTALDFLKRAKLCRGEKVLINGASGAVGTAMVQIAKHYGAEVTGVCSTANIHLVQSLRADHVIDYTQDDFTSNGRTYDVIADIAGTAPFRRCRKSLSNRGRLLLILGSLTDMLRAPWVALTSRRKIIVGPAAERVEDLHTLAKLAQVRHYRPVIDRCYPMNEIVQAHHHVDSGHKRGSVIIVP